MTQELYTESKDSRAHASHGSVPPSGFWESRLLPFLNRYCVLLCLCLVAVACIRIISTYNALSLTADEPTHFACGLEYVAQHVYRIEPEHPPLPRMMVALGPYIIGARPVEMTFANDDGLVAIGRTKNVDRTIFLMRLGALPFFLLACLVVGIWGNEFGRPVAVMALALFTLLPTVLADAGLAATDMALGANVAAAFLAFIFWAKKPTLGRSMLLGSCTALACLSNFSALGYVPTAVVLTLACYVAVRWPAWCRGYSGESGLLGLAWYLLVGWAGWRALWDLGKRRLAPFSIAALTMGLVIWAFYWFSFGRVGSHGFNFLLPAPEFFYGLRDAMHHSSGGHGAFLLGQFGWAGWWYYFPVVLFFKLPVAFLVLFVLGVFVCIKERARPIYLTPLAFSLGILLPAMRSHVNIGVRHVEPIYIGFAIIAALGLKQLLQWARTSVVSGLTAGALLLWMIVSVGAQHPDYLAYVNAFAGKQPEKIFVDSSVDWGEDMKFLGKRLHALGVQEFSMSAIDAMGIAYPDYHQTWDGLPPFKPVNPCVPTAGWNVLSVTIEKSLTYWEGSPFYPGPDTKPWFDGVAPTERIGPLLLYNIPADAKLNCSRASETSAARRPLAVPNYAELRALPDLSHGEIKTAKLADNFYTFEDEDGVVAVLSGSDGLFVVNDRPAPMSPKITAAIQKISDSPIRFLISTRIHSDGEMKIPINGEHVELIPSPDGQLVYFPQSNILMVGDFYGSIQYPNVNTFNGGNLDFMLSGFDNVLRLSGPGTRILPSHGPLISRTEVMAHQGMLAAIRFRVNQLFAQGKTQYQVLALNPTAQYEALAPNSKESTERFVIQLYADASSHKSAW
jgi:hypothetical protein